MFLGINWIETANPFQLAKPPESFLEQLFTHDPQLRIFASTSDPLYRVSRIVGARCRPWLKFLKEYPDTAINIQYAMWPVGSVYPPRIGGFSWARVLLELQERDQHQFDSGDAVADRLDEFDVQHERALDAAIANEADARAGDLYGTYQLMNGSSVSLAHRKHEGARTGQRRLVSRPYRPAGSGPVALFTGR